MWPLAAASPCGSGASGSCHCGWAPWLPGPADMGRAKDGRQTRRGSGAAGHPPATGPETLPQSPCHPGRAQNAPEPAGPGPCPCPGREPVSAPLRALAQPSAQPAAPRRSPSGPGAQPGPKHSPRRADGGGWRFPAAAAPQLTYRRCKWPTGKGSGGAPELRKCGSGDQWAGPWERPNRNDGGGRAWRRLHHAPSKDGGSLKRPRTPRRRGLRGQHARCDWNGQGAGGYTVPKGSLRTAGEPVPFHTAQAGRPCSAMGPPSRALPPSPVWGKQQHLLHGRKGVRGPPPTLAEPTSSSGSCQLDSTATLEATQAPALSQTVQHPYRHPPQLSRTKSSQQRVDSCSLEGSHDFLKKKKQKLKPKIIKEQLLLEK